MSSIEQEVRKLGYDKEDLNIQEIDYVDPKNKNFSQKSINHSLAKNKIIEDVNFDFAAATGSNYTLCKFYNCSMEQSDFEYCTFDTCYFSNNKRVIASFNNSNFINCEFKNDKYATCTFCGVLFDNCTFDNINFDLSTFEGSVFCNCKFYNMNLSLINMEYIEISDATMNNVILPFSQIPYMLGCLEYLKNTKDIVFISSNESTINNFEYINQAIPKLIDYWKEKSKHNSEFYFPLSNVYIFNKDFQKANESITKGLKACVNNQDYRMIKYYCKLISQSDLFKESTLEEFYAIINHQVSKKANSSEARNFMRNIGEIRDSLFSLKNNTLLYLKILTNMHFHNYSDVGNVLNKIFSIAKMKESPLKNNLVFELSENSPFTIAITIKGNEDNLINILISFLEICNIDFDLLCSNSSDVKSLIPQNHLLSEKVNDLYHYLQKNRIEFKLQEYQIDNSRKCETFKIQPFFYSNYFNLYDKANLVQSLLED